MISETPKQIAARLFARTSHGIKLGLERMEKAVLRFDNPQDGYVSIHVAGTNGKGSVCAFIESALRHSGMKTGLFTSPHIVDFEERFIINGRPVESGEWVDVYKNMETVIAELDLTFFEAATLIAFELFKRERVEYAVFETGLGGRLDSTNVLKPRVSVITRIAMDHMGYLGNDLLSIAGEKLGIIKGRVPLVMTDPDSQDVRRLALSLCLQKGIPCEFIAAGEASGVAETEDGTSFTYHNQKFELPLAGAYQVENAMTAIKALKAAGINDMTAIAAGMKKTYLPGRFQTVSINGKTVIFDVGHNPDAASAFVKTLSSRHPDTVACFVTGIMKDKDSAAMFEQYCKKASRIILTKPDVERSTQTSDLRTKIPEWFEAEVLEIKNVNKAVSAALASPEKTICIIGSFFTVGEAMTALSIRPYPGI